MPLDHQLRRLLHLDVGRDAHVFGVPFSRRAEQGDARGGHVPPVQQRRIAVDPDQPAPGPLPHQLTEAAAAEVERHRVAARARVLVDDHHFRPIDRPRRSRKHAALARGHVSQHRPVQHVLDEVRDVAALIEALVDHRRLAVELREVIAGERGVARPGSVGHVDVGHTPAGERVHEVHVALDPRPVAERRLAGDRHDGDSAGTLE